MRILHDKKETQKGQKNLKHEKIRYAGGEFALFILLNHYSWNLPYRI